MILQMSIECVDNADGLLGVVVFDDKTFPISFQQVCLNHPFSLSAQLKPIKYIVLINTFLCSVCYIYIYLIFFLSLPGRCFWRWTTPAQVRPGELSCLAPQQFA